MFFTLLVILVKIKYWENILSKMSAENWKMFYFPWSPGGLVRSVVIIYKLKRCGWSNTATLVLTLQSEVATINGRYHVIYLPQISGWWYWWYSDIPLGGMMLRTIMISLMNNVMTYYLPLRSVCLTSTPPAPVRPQISVHMTSSWQMILLDIFTTQCAPEMD